MNNIADNWNSRYSSDEYVYGELPNNYLKEKLLKYSPGNILFPGEGEGRNAVYAAKNGWKVWAYDISTAAKIKAEKLALKNNVHLDYRIGEIQNLKYDNEHFDATALIYLHMAENERKILSESIYNLIRPDGIVIAELFSKNHIEYQKKNSSVGGPRNIDLLYSIEDVQKEFNNFKIIELKEEEIELFEGSFHSGTASVIRFILQKPI
ncbi:MAG: methyltransferase domain-containing protein [Fermentimonas sp.]|nr:methyltransferase domain-containing protein [Fermentimonas sp.]